MFVHPHEQQHLRPLSNVLTAHFTKLSLRSPNICKYRVRPRARK
jgi:hypothetical protein